jgi:hypothetical protein
MRFLLSFSSSWEVAGCHIINNKNPETARQMRYLIFDFLSMRLPTVETRTHERLVAHRKSILKVNSPFPWNLLLTSQRFQ